MPDTLEVHKRRNPFRVPLKLPWGLYRDGKMIGVYATHAEAVRMKTLIRVVKT